MAQFKVGDSVRVKSGVKDPDFQVAIGGWQGRILTLAPEENLADVTWDSLTLAQMPKELLDLCFREGTPLRASRCPSMSLNRLNRVTKKKIFTTYWWRFTAVTAWNTNQKWSRLYFRWLI
ncbi:MAG: hypothetical protein H6657_07160 [Ardenticatenaceae bacterium]|nr:hypothetical protein [Ardenticatenaceae bacterium]